MRYAAALFSLAIIPLTSLPGFAFCTPADVDNHISVKSAPIGPDHPKSGMIFTEIAKHLQMYHDYYTDPSTGRIIYRVKITNGYKKLSMQGSTVCSCMIFDKEADAFPLLAEGGRWGVNAGDNRVVGPMTSEVPPAMFKLVDRVTVVAGYCPTDRILKGAEKLVLDGAWGAARAYAIKQGVPKEALPEKRPGT